MQTKSNDSKVLIYFVFVLFIWFAWNKRGIFYEFGRSLFVRDFQSFVIEWTLHYWWCVHRTEICRAKVLWHHVHIGEFGMAIRRWFRAIYIDSSRTIASKFWPFDINNHREHQPIEANRFQRKAVDIDRKILWWYSILEYQMIDIHTHVTCIFSLFDFFVFKFVYTFVLNM